MPTTNNPATLTPRQQQCISALLAGSRLNAAAQACGVSARTVLRWLREPEFVAEMARQRGNLTTEIAMQVMAQAFGAIRTVAHLSTESEDEAIRLRAAIAILSLATGTVADLEREGRFAILAAQVAELQKQRATLD